MSFSTRSMASVQMKHEDNKCPVNSSSDSTESDSNQRGRIAMCVELDYDVDGQVLAKFSNGDDDVPEWARRFLLDSDYREDKDNKHTNDSSSQNAEFNSDHRQSTSLVDDSELWLPILKKCLPELLTPSLSNFRCHCNPWDPVRKCFCNQLLLRGKPCCMLQGIQSIFHCDENTLPTETHLSKQRRAWKYILAHYDVTGNIDGNYSFHRRFRFRRSECSCCKYDQCDPYVGSVDEVYHRINEDLRTAPIADEKSGGCSDDDYDDDYPDGCYFTHEERRQNSIENDDSSDNDSVDVDKYYAENGELPPGFRDEDFMGEDYSPFYGVPSFYGVPYEAPRPSRPEVPMCVH